MFAFLKSLRRKPDAIGESKPHSLKRIATILFWFPLILLVPVFYIVSERIPDRNHGSIGDGFRKLNILLEVIFPVMGVCWGLALLLTAIVDVPQVPKSRGWIWLAVITALAVAILILSFF